MIAIEQLKALNRLENIAITEHARVRLYERNISIDDIVNGINTGEIIKQYILFSAVCFSAICKGTCPGHIL